jgi:hypothetical protein
MDFIGSKKYFLQKIKKFLTIATTGHTDILKSDGGSYGQSNKTQTSRP